MSDDSEIVSDPSGRKPRPTPVKPKAPKGKAKPKAKPASVGPVYTAAEFAEAARQAQISGILAPPPVPPNPVPGTWWNDVFAAWLRILAPLGGPITIQR